MYVIMRVNVALGTLSFVVSVRISVPNEWINLCSKTGKSAEQKLYEYSYWEDVPMNGIKVLKKLQTRGL